MDIINGIFLGAAIGTIVALPAIVSEVLHRRKNLPILVDVHACWGRTCTPVEVFWLSLFAHELMAMLFGAIYMLLVVRGWQFHNFELWPLVEYALYFWIFMCLIILPLVGMGLFGRRESGWIWLELLIAHHLFGLGLWLALRLFPVFLP